jgi:hypothetical protein
MFLKCFFSSFVTVLLSFLLRLKIIRAENERKLLKEIHKICWDGVVESAVLEFFYNNLWGLGTE